MSDKRPHHPDTDRRAYELRVWDALADFDQHESGQLRLATAGEQTHLLPLPDSLIPRTEETP